jgi:hypothetical protein
MKIACVTNHEPQLGWKYFIVAGASEPEPPHLMAPRLSQSVSHAAAASASGHDHGRARLRLRVYERQSVSDSDCRMIQQQIKMTDALYDHGQIDQS